MNDEDSVTGLGDDHAQTFALPPKPPEPEPEVEAQVVKSEYQPSGLDPYFGKGGRYELDPATGMRRPVAE